MPRKFEVADTSRPVEVIGASPDAKDMNYPFWAEFAYTRAAVEKTMAGLGERAPRNLPVALGRVGSLGLWRPALNPGERSFNGLAESRRAPWVVAQGRVVPVPPSKTIHHNLALRELDALGYLMPEGYLGDTVERVLVDPKETAGHAYLRSAAARVEGHTYRIREEVIEEVAPLAGTRVADNIVRLLRYANIVEMTPVPAEPLYIGCPLAPWPGQAV